MLAKSTPIRLVTLMTVVLSAGLIAAAGTIAPALAAADGRPIAGIQCERQEYGDFHIHAHVDVFVDGAARTVPAMIGILPAQKCLYWMHTHDDSGIIHIEAPKKRAFTLAPFFELWKTTAAGTPERKDAPKIFVNGKRVNKHLDQLELENHMQIAIVYGKEPVSIPSSYDFAKAGL